MDSIFQLIERGDVPKVKKLVEGNVKGSKNILSRRASMPKSPLTGKTVRLPPALSTELMTYGSTPLLWAAAFGQLTMVELFLAHGADVNESDRVGRTALMYSMQPEGDSVVQCLIKHGANLEARDMKFRSTALEWAAYKLIPNAVKVLIAAGAAVGTLNNRGQSALRLALEFHEESPDRLEITEVLLSAGADVSDAEFLFSEELIVNNFTTVMLCVNHGAAVNGEFLEMTRQVMGEEKETQLREVLHKKVGL